MAVQVSVVVPNYNKGKLIRHSIESLLRQTYADWEAIVVDDCSTDDSWGIIGEYPSKDNRIRHVRNDQNKGGCFSRNRGAKMARGKYLIFLDSDDWLADDCLEKRVSEFEKEDNRDIDLLIFEMKTTKDGQTGSLWKNGSRNDALISFLRHSIVWSIMMPIWRREAFEKTGGFDEAFPRLQDVELHTRALLGGARYRFAERKSPDCFYFVDDSRMTVNHARMMENFVTGVLLYVEKMSKLVHTPKEHKALLESRMAAIRGVGDSFQTRRIDRQFKDKLYDAILQDGKSPNWLKLYAYLYSLGCNKVHGFNYLYHKLYRMF